MSQTLPDISPHIYCLVFFTNYSDILNYISRYPVNLKNISEKETYRVVIIGLFSLVLFLLIFNAIINLFLDGILKPKLLSGINSSKDINVTIDDLSYSIFNSQYTLKNISVAHSEGIKENSDSVNVKINSVKARINWLPLIFNNRYKFPSITIDKLLIKQYNNAVNDKSKNKDSNNIFGFLDTLSKQLHYISADLVEIKQGNYINKDIPSGISDSVQNFKLKLKDVLFDSTSTKKVKFKIAEEIDLGIQKLNINFEDMKYKLYFTDFAMNSESESIGLKNFSFKPYMNDKNYFKTRQFRTDRFILLIEAMKISGFSFVNFFNNQELIIDGITIKKFMLDALTNMCLPEDPDAPLPDMPNSIVNKLPFTLDIKKIELKNGDIYVKELYPFDETPGILQFADSYATITNLKNNNKVHFDIITKLAATGNLKVNFDIGLNPQKMEFQYSGELSRMNAADLNKFISIADRVKVTTGIINYVTFNVTASGDTAIAEATPVYYDLSMNKLDEDSGKSSGIFERFQSFIVNTFVIKKDNMGDEIESAKVNYVRKPTNAFLEFVCSALRTAIGAVVGFK